MPSSISYCLPDPLYPISPHLIYTSPHFTSPHLHLTSFHLTSFTLHLISPHLIYNSPPFTSPHLHFTPFHITSSHSCMPANFHLSKHTLHNPFIYLFNLCLFTHRPRPFTLTLIASTHVPPFHNPHALITSLILIVSNISILTHTTDRSSLSHLISSLVISWNHQSLHSASFFLDFPCHTFCSIYHHREKQSGKQNMFSLLLLILVESLSADTHTEPEKIILGSSCDD
jgi:hypothetical protein